MNDLIPKTSEPQLSGERFSVTYALFGSELAAHHKAVDITYEQTVEFPPDLTPEGVIKDQIVGRIESFRQIADGHYEAEISYAVETAGEELTQFLTLLFGNTSIKPGIRVEHIGLSPALERIFPGPRFGVRGVRELLGVENRPLLCSALKPMGLSATDLATIAHRFTLGGMDLIKDDHGLADQSFCRFEERVEKVCAQVRRAMIEVGGTTLYAPNVTAPHDQVLKRAHFAKQAGAGALLISPGISGFDAVQMLRGDPELRLPIIMHPALLGSFVTGREHGIPHRALFGHLARLAGADASIYPNFGGRFSFSREECGNIVQGCSENLGRLRPIFPMPGGGMTFENIPQMREVYGKEVIFLIGGGLFRHSEDLVENCRYFRRMVE